MSYNGFTNPYTWMIHNWIQQDMELLESMEYLADCEHRIIGHIGKDAVVGNLAKDMKNYFMAGNPLADQANLYADLMNEVLATGVDWNNLAESYVNEEED